MCTIKNIILGGIIAATALIGCDTGKRPESHGIKEEMASREVKKVSDAEIMIQGEKLGLQLLDTVEKKFKHELLSALKRAGVSGAIRYCNLQAYQIVSDLEDSLKITIRRVTNKPRNPLDTLSTIEKEIFEAYEYAPDMAAAQIQKHTGNQLILTKPIKISNGLCLNCHGAPGNQITEENYKLIKELYPKDKAIHYKPGDLRGMWSIRIPIKTIVSQM